MENTLNIPEYTTIYLKGTTNQSAYVDRNLITSGMLPDDIWDNPHHDAKSKHEYTNGDDLLSLLDQLMDEKNAT